MGLDAQILIPTHFPSFSALKAGGVSPLSALCCQITPAIVISAPAGGQGGEGLGVHRDVLAALSPDTPAVPAPRCGVCLPWPCPGGVPRAGFLGQPGRRRGPSQPIPGYPGPSRAHPGAAGREAGAEPGRGRAAVTWRGHVAGEPGPAAAAAAPRAVRDRDGAGRAGREGGRETGSGREGARGREWPPPAPPPLPRRGKCGRWGGMGRALCGAAGGFGAVFLLFR